MSRKTETPATTGIPAFKRPDYRGNFGLVEHDSVPWEALPGQMEKTTEKEWRLRDRPWRLPHSYTLQAVKRSE